MCCMLCMYVMCKVGMKCEMKGVCMLYGGLISGVVVCGVWFDW